jgi:hypothetical protein
MWRWLGLLGAFSAQAAEFDAALHWQSQHYRDSTRSVFALSTELQQQWQGWHYQVDTALVNDSVIAEQSAFNNLTGLGWRRTSTPNYLQWRQHFLRYREDRLSVSIGLQQLDWALLDRGSMFDVWQAYDFTDLLSPKALAQNALRLQWRGKDSNAVQWDFIYTPKATLSKLPAGEFAAPIALPSEKPADQWGLRVSGHWRQQDLAAYAFTGINASPTLCQATFRLCYDSLRLLGVSVVSPLDGSALLRVEAGQVWQQRSDGQNDGQNDGQKISQPADTSYHQYSIALEREWFGVFADEDQWLALVQWSDATNLRTNFNANLHTNLPVVSQSQFLAVLPELGQFASRQLDYRRLFQQQLLGKVQFDTDGSMQSILALEWAIDTANHGHSWLLSWQHRLADQGFWRIEWQQLQGKSTSFWGQYADKDRLQLTLNWQF